MSRPIVILVEDEPEYRKEISGLLVGLGCSVIAPTTVPELATLMLENGAAIRTAALILVDWRLSEWSRGLTSRSVLLLAAMPQLRAKMLGISMTEQKAMKQAGIQQMPKAELIAGLQTGTAPRGWTFVRSPTGDVELVRLDEREAAMKKFAAEFKHDVRHVEPDARELAHHFLCLQSAAWNLERGAEVGEETDLGKTLRPASFPQDKSGPELLVGWAAVDARNIEAVYASLERLRDMLVAVAEPVLPRQ